MLSASRSVAMATDILDTAGSCTASDKVLLTGASSSTEQTLPREGPGPVTGLLTPARPRRILRRTSPVRALPAAMFCTNHTGASEYCHRIQNDPASSPRAARPGGGEATLPQVSLGAKGRKGGKTRNTQEDEHRGWASLCQPCRAPWPYPSTAGGLT